MLCHTKAPCEPPARAARRAVTLKGRTLSRRTKRSSDALQELVPQPVVLVTGLLFDLEGDQLHRGGSGHERAGALAAPQDQRPSAREALPIERPSAARARCLAQCSRWALSSLPCPASALRVPRALSPLRHNRLEIAVEPIDPDSLALLADINHRVEARRALLELPSARGTQEGALTITSGHTSKLIRIFARFEGG